MASKVKHWLGSGAGIAAALVLAWWWQHPQALGVAKAAASAAPASAKAQGAQGVSVEATQVQALDLQDSAQAVGSLQSRQSVVLRPEVGARIVALPFQDGARVRRGQVLVRLDDQLPRAQVQQSEAERAIAQANHRRNQELVAQGFVSQRALDESAAALQVSQAKLTLAQATLARLTLRAPFDGVLGIRRVAVGDYLKDGADIVNIEDMDAVFVDFRLPERYQRALRPGLPVQVAVDALPGTQWQAHIQAINPLLDAQGRAVSVRACIDNRQQQLRPGMFARVHAMLGVRSNALVVPEQAIVPQAGRTVVYKLVPGTSDSHTLQAQRVVVELGLRLPGWVEVVQGLAAGDRIVTAGQQRLQRDAMAVKVISVDEAQAAPAPAPAAHAAASAAVPPPLPGANPCQTRLPSHPAAPGIQG